MNHLVRQRLLIAPLLLVSLLAGYALALAVGDGPIVSDAALAGERADEPKPIPAEVSGNERRTIELFQNAAPSVVNINTLGRELDYFTRRVRETERGSGTGFLWDDQGHIVTNYHVIRGASGAQVVLDDQTVLRADLVGASPDHDLAVLRVKLKDAQARPLPIGASDPLVVGQTVFAIGNPFGLDHTLTQGIVSALGREITSVSGQRIVDMVQTDAAINPGNSGGPLLDSQGRVIGVNTAIFSPSGASNGIGFAVPIDTVKRVVPQLIEHGEYRRPSLGVRIDERIGRTLLNRVNKRGVLVLGIEPNSGAAAAGLVPARRGRGGAVILGDIIQAIDGTPVNSVSDLRLVLDERETGEVVTCTIERNRSVIEVKVRLD